MGKGKEGRGESSAYINVPEGNIVPAKLPVEHTMPVIPRIVDHVRSIYAPRQHFDNVGSLLIANMYQLELIKNCFKIHIEIIVTLVHQIQKH